MSGLDELFTDTQAKPIVEKPPPRPRDECETVTPDGTKIAFLLKPRRHYEIDGDKVPSVSQITGILDKPALPWWAQGVAVESMVELVRRGALPPERIAESNKESLVALLTQEKLTVNHVKREAADRGSRVHDAMEDWALSGVMPDPEGLPEDEQGYIHGLRLFIEELKPEPDGIETIVGSKEHRFAGRCDVLRCRIPPPAYGCVALDRKTGEEIHTIVESGLYTVDLKTTTGVFQEAHFQVAGYSGAAVECGHPAVDHSAILRVTVDGRYEFVESVASYEDFLALRQLYGVSKAILEKAA